MSALTFTLKQAPAQRMDMSPLVCQKLANLPFRLKKSFIHVDVGVGTWVCLFSGVHDWGPAKRHGQYRSLQILVFD